MKYILTIVENKHLARTIAFASGALLTLSFAPFYIWPIAFVSVVGYFIVVRDETGWIEIWLRGFLFGMGKYLVGASWILPSLINYAQVNLVTAVSLFLIVGISLAFWFAFVGYFALHLKSKVMGALVFACGWVLLEICLTFHYGYSFPFLHVGYGFIDTPLAGYAPIGGVWVVSLGAVITAIAGVHVLEKYWNTLLVAIVIWVLGFGLSFISWTEPDEKHVVALVQANIPLEEKFDPTKLDRVWSRYESLTMRADDADLIVWPESAIPATFDVVKGDIRQLVTSIQTPLVFGAFELVGLPPNDKRYNATIGFDGITHTYRKQQLVPFGEYLPDLPVFTDLFKAVVFPMSSIDQPDGLQPPIELHNLTVAPSVCYEIGYPQLVNYQLPDARLIVNISEDSWFGNTHGAWQQLQAGRMRAIETGRPVVRVANDGPTAIIEATGDVAAQLDRYVTDVLLYEVTTYVKATPFVRWGVYPICTLMLLSLLGALLSEILRNRKYDH